MTKNKLNPVPINISILEDHQGVIDGYLYRLQDEPALHVAGIAMYGQELERLLAENPTDILILDINVPISPNDQNPFPVMQFIPELLKKYPGLVILVISIHHEVVLIERLVELGIAGYIFKNDAESIKRLPQIILALKASGSYFSQGAYSKMRSIKPGPDSSQLTPRQYEVLSMCAAYPDGTSRELAARLGVSGSTFRNLLSTAYARLDVRTRTAAIAKMQHMGLSVSNYPDEVTRPLYQTTKTQKEKSDR